VTTAKNPYASVSAILSGLSFLLVGFGLLSSLIGIRATLEGFDTRAIGVIGSAFYVGFLAGAMVGPSMVARVGHIRVYSALASVGAATVLAYPLLVSPTAWSVIRVITGFSISGMYVVTESWLNAVTTNETRGRILSLYLVLANLGFGLGQLLLVVTDPGSVTPFLVVAAIYSLSVVPLTLSTTPAPAHATQVRGLPIRQVVQSAPLAPATSAVSGIGVSIVIGLGAAYGAAIGLTVEEVGWLMATAMLGGVILQWPLGALSDRFPRRLVILATTITAGAAALLGLATPSGSVALFLVMGVYTAFSFPLYSMAISHLNDVIPAGMTVAASGVLIMAYGLGSIAGPYLGALVMDRFGPASFWTAIAVSNFVLVPYLVYRLFKRRVLAQAPHFHPLAPEASAAPGLLVDEF
jgi:MFS family permease